MNLLREIHSHMQPNKTNRIIKSLGFIFIGILLFTACTSNTIYKKPADLIPQKQMVNLLTDMYLANAATNVKTKKLERNIDYMPLVYEKYGIDSLRFQTSNIYYMSRIDDYEAIYKKVELRLKKMLDTTETAQKVKDSLKLLKNKKPSIEEKELPKNIKRSLEKENFLKNTKPLREKKPKQLDRKQE